MKFTTTHIHALNKISGDKIIPRLCCSNKTPDDENTSISVERYKKESMSGLYVLKG